MSRNNKKKKQSQKSQKPAVPIREEEEVLVLLLGHGEILVGGKQRVTSAAVTISYPAFLALVPVEAEQNEGEEAPQAPQTQVHLLRPVPAVVADVEEAFRTLRVPRSRVIEVYKANSMISNTWLRYRGQTIQVMEEYREARSKLVVDAASLGKDEEGADDSEPFPPFPVEEEKAAELSSVAEVMEKIASDDEARAEEPQQEPPAEMKAEDDNLIKTEDGNPEIAAASDAQAPAEEAGLNESPSS